MRTEASKEVKDMANEATFIEVGIKYHILGDIQDGILNGEPFITHEEVTRKITKITEKYIICECSRKFLRNKNLKLYIY